MKVVSDPVGFVAKGEEERPVKFLFWACINDKGECF
jgi:hemolysin-activating ACP:hemolysin acyltransferase